MRRLCVFLAAALFAAPALAQEVVVDLADSSPADPGSGWSAFTAAQGTAGKPFRFRFVSTDANAPNLSVIPGGCGAGSCVRLRPGDTGAFATEIECTAFTPPPLEPVFTAATAGQCFYRLQSSGSHTDVFIYHHGLLEAGADIRVRIEDLQPMLPFLSFQDFDTDAAPDGPPQPDSARPSANLVVVVDKSGSMAWSNNPTAPGCAVTAPPPAGCEPSRWEVLESALAQMGAVAKAYILPGDQIGAVAFDANAQIVQNIVGANAPTIDGVVAALGALTPGGSTSIGDGVDELATELAANAGDNNMMLLFSDGIQNAPFFLRLVGDVLRINETANSDVGPSVRDLPTNFDLCSFALRAEVPDPLDLQAISDLRCGGLNAQTTSVDPADADLVQFFLQVLNRALIGDKLEVAEAAPVSLEGRRSLLERRFVIGRDSIGFTTLVNWTRPRDGLATMILEKDGVTFRAFDGDTVPISERGRQHWAMTLRQPACGRGPDNAIVCLDTLGGEWRLVARPVTRERGFEANVLVVSDNASFASEFSATQPASGIGQPIRFAATLTEAGEPVEGLPPEAVRVLVSPPGGNWGDALARATVQPTPGDSNDPLTAAGLKTLAALADPEAGAAVRDAMTRKPPLVLEMAEAAPGVYEAEIAAAPVSGAYGVRFELDAKGLPINDAVQRRFETAVDVPVPVDPERTLASLTVTSVTADCPAGQNCFVVRFAPQSAEGVLVGPNFAPVVTVEGAGVVQTSPVRDNLDGSYEASARCPAAGPCEPLVTVRGEGLPFQPPPRAIDRPLYDVKMVCGTSEGGREFGAERGRYATVVTVLAGHSDARIAARLALATPPGEGQPGERIDLGVFRVPAEHALSLSCADIARRIRRTVGSAPYFLGYLTLAPSAPVRIGAVYTAEPGTPRRGMTPALHLMDIAPRP